MTTYLTCRCGCKFAVSTIEYMAGKAICPGCGIDMNGHYVESKPMKMKDIRVKEDKNGI